MALLLGACSPKAEPPRPRLQLDCSLSYEALSAKILAQPDLKLAAPTPGEPYRFYMTPGGGEAFIFTEPGAPGHPAILKQEGVSRAGKAVMTNSGCPYGNKAGYEQVMAYLQGLQTR
jgi:hypothetical protein